MFVCVCVCVMSWHVTAGVSVTTFSLRGYNASAKCIMCRACENKVLCAVADVGNLSLLVLMFVTEGFSQYIYPLVRKCTNTDTLTHTYTHTHIQTDKQSKP